MDLIIRTCRLIALGALFAVPIVAHAADQTTDLYWFGQRFELAQQDENAIKAYSQLLTRHPQSEVATNRLFEAAIRDGNLPEALRAMRAAQLADVADTDAPLIFFADAFKRKKWSEAAKAIAELEQQKDFAFMAPMLRGWLAVKQGKDSGFDLAAMRAAPLTAYYGDDQLIYFDLAAGNLEQAKLRLRSFGGLGEIHARHLALYAHGAVKRTGDASFSGAIERQIGLDPQNALAGPVTAETGIAALLARLALALDEQKQPAKGLYFARLAQWIAPDDDAAKLILADMLAKQGVRQQSEALLQSISQSSAFWPQAMGKLVQLAATSEAAVALAQTASSARPSSPTLKLLHAQSLEKAGKRASAITIYRSLAGGESDATVRQRTIYQLLLAAALDAEGDWPGTRAALEKAVEIDPGNAQALNYLGYSLLERREDVPRGFELVSRAHKLAPDSAAITDSLGWGYFLQGNVEAALPLLERAAQAAADDVAINEHLGDAYWKAGRKVEARYAWRAAALQADGKAKDRLTRKTDFGWSEEVASP